MLITIPVVVAKPEDTIDPVALMYASVSVDGAVNLTVENLGLPSEHRFWHVLIVKVDELTLFTIPVVVASAYDTIAPAPFVPANVFADMLLNVTSTNVGEFATHTP